jgi:chromosome segregation ATPase
MFCFGEKDSRSKNLLSLVNEHSFKTGICKGASVTVEFSNTVSQQTATIKRSIIVLNGKAKSEYTFQSDQSRNVTISRTSLVEQLCLLGINLDVVESFVCMQQGSSVTFFCCSYIFPTS